MQCSLLKSSLYDMLRKNLVTLATATTDAAQTLAIAQEHSMDIPSQDQLKQSVEKFPIPGKELKKAIFPRCLPHSINAKILEKVSFGLKPCRLFFLFLLFLVLTFRNGIC